MTQAARVVPVEQVTWNAGTSFESARPGVKRSSSRNSARSQIRAIQINDFSTGSTFSRPGQKMSEVEQRGALQNGA